MHGKKNPNPTPLEIERRKAGLSRRALAEKSGVAMYCIRNYEQLRVNINNGSVANAKLIADAIGVPIERILNPAEGVTCDKKEGGQRDD